MTEKTFSTATLNTTSFEEIEARRFAKLKASPKEMFNSKFREAFPLEIGFEHTKEILGL